MQVYGAKHNNTHSIVADRIVATPPSSGSVSGSAVILAVTSQPSGDLLLHADGYPVLVTSRTSLANDPQIHGLSDIVPGDWIEYHGRWRADGTIVAESARIAPESIRFGEQKLRQKTEPAAAPRGSGQNTQTAFSKAVLGLHPLAVPEWPDPPMQARIVRIGTSLIPAYQKNLPAGDPAKIDFRFQLVSEKRWHDAMDWPSGLILVPYQIVSRLSDDSELAAVLADHIASVLERQVWRELPKTRALEAGNLASDAGWFVPGVGLAGLPTWIGSVKLQDALLDQSGRVALELMHNAGYDIAAAPRTWWRLNGKPGRPLWKINMPRRARYQYSVLGAVWRDTEPNDAPAKATPTTP